MEKIEKGVEEIDSKGKTTAGKILLQAMENITDEKLQAARLRELSGVARDMAGVIEKVNGKGSGNVNATGVQFNIYTPQILKESDLGPVIDVVPERK